VAAHPPPPPPARTHLPGRPVRALVRARVILYYIILYYIILYYIIYIYMRVYRTHLPGRTMRSQAMASRAVKPCPFISRIAAIVPDCRRGPAGGQFGLFLTT
jgi:hypothetical protein